MKSLHCTTLHVPFASLLLKNKSTLVTRGKIHTFIIQQGEAQGFIN